MNRNEETAFPCTETLNHGESFSPGMTLRDYFAAQALPAVYQSFWDDHRSGGFGPVPEGWEFGLAVDAYEMADAMLAARTAREAA